VHKPLSFKVTNVPVLYSNSILKQVHKPLSFNINRRIHSFKYDGGSLSLLAAFAASSVSLAYLTGRVSHPRAISHSSFQANLS
jgi:hypothetical protein